MAKFIRYEKKGDILYASVYNPVRVDGNKINYVEYLGKVIDQVNGIFKSKDRGVFKFSLEDGYSYDGIECYSNEKEKFILDFGDIFIFFNRFKDSKLYNIFKNIIYNRSDTLFSLIFYKIFQSESNSYAKIWWEGSYARKLFPNASLNSQRISEFLIELGDESNQREFFNEYLKLFSDNDKKCGLIDSTGLPNTIDIPLTALSNHMGNIEVEMRLIYIVDKKTKRPLFFRYIAGNIIDVTTLETTMLEMKELNLDIEFLLLDAGYFSEDNIKKMYDKGMDFITRMPTNRKVYKELIKKYREKIEKIENLVNFNGRLIYIIKEQIELYGKVVYAYICVDVQRKNEEMYKLLTNSLEGDKDCDKIEEETITKGTFVIVSPLNIETKEILSMYYSRQEIERIFEICKSLINILPLRCHSEATLRGCLMLAFLASLTYIELNEYLKGSKVNMTYAINMLRNLKCKVYENSTIILEPTKQMKDIAELFKLEFPTSL